ncbi:AI-2E family transporter, partial [uncultured Gemmiger sp.]|uniref:AI-2E family transporter n=1 Tax=uncultured Gemmiger sp. TaxID=1623490 RepID=UPI0025EB89F4
AYAVAILLLMLLAWLVVPQIVNSIGMLFTNFPSYIQGVQNMLLYVQSEYGIDLQQATKMLDDSEAMVKEIYAMATEAMPQIVASIGSVASNFVAIFTSIAASIYMLADKDHLLHQLRTLAHAFLPEKVAENTLRICHYANVNFTGFFVGKIIDSAIIGVITFVAMTILRLDFAVLISVFIGITNIIPVFGPFIGAIPSVFILLLIDPLQAVIFCVLILIIQQLDGNFIGPKILGSSIGISALWILFSIVVGGDLFGIVGMVVGVPVFATLYGLAQEFVHYLLDRRGIDSEGKPVEHEAEDTENVFE